MLHKRLILSLLGFVVGLAVCETARAQFTIAGVETQTWYNDAASFEVQTEAGYDVTALLNDKPVLTDVVHRVDDADYYELLVESRHQTTGAESSELLLFIVLASERGSSERGLPPWVPYPPVPSAAAEFEGARLEIVAPREFPQGLEIPVIARVLDSEDRRVGVNGLIEAAEFPGHSLRLLRGVGSAFLPPATAAVVVEYTAAIQTLQSAKQITVEESTDWTAVSGDLSSSADWGEDARIHVTADLTVAAGSTLTIGPGSVIKLASEVEIRVDGSLVINGTKERPAVFLPEDRGSPWGGFVLWSSPAQADVHHAIFTGSGARENWISETPGTDGSHRQNQCLFYLAEGARATLTDSYIVDNRGQAGHGDDAFLTMTRCLVQKCVSVGQYNDGRVVIEDSELIEFPAWDAPFEDRDNDGLYLNGATDEEPHSLRNCLVGWALDDGIDSGSGAGGATEVIGCWIESCYHEALAFSNGRTCTVSDTVTLNCGQGIECGFDDPLVDADHCLSTANLVGARFGDNYDWDYFGFLTVTNSLLLYNRRDVWGRNWDDWTVRLDQMDIRGNYLTAPHADHPDNAVWQPASDASLLEPFFPAPATTVGVGLAIRGGLSGSADFSKGVPVRLSSFTGQSVSVDFAVDSDDGPLDSGTLQFPAGETVQKVYLDDGALEDRLRIRVTLSNPVGADLTGLSEAEIIRKIPVTLIPRGAEWKYWDKDCSQAPGPDWKTLEFDDSAWEEDFAELGYGDGDEATVIDGGPSDDRKPSYYFRKRIEVATPGSIDTLLLRLKRDDGAIVYINGEEVFRSNMPEGEVTCADWADDTTGSEGDFRSQAIDPSVLALGPNIVAVEVHQANATSSDVSFDLELSGERTPSLVPRFSRGDANADGATDISDAVTILLFLFQGGSLRCVDAADIDDNSAAEITDAIRLLGHLFRGGVAPEDPAGFCGEDSTGDELSCESFPPCF